MFDSFECRRDKAALMCVCGYLDTQTEQYNQHLGCKPMHRNNFFITTKFGQLYMCTCTKRDELV